jgi:hypothetical protein
MGVRQKGEAGRFWERYGRDEEILNKRLLWLARVLTCSSNPHVAALAIYLMTLGSLFLASMIPSKVRNLAMTKVAGCWCVGSRVEKVGLSLALVRHVHTLSRGDSLS